MGYFASSFPFPLACFGDYLVVAEDARVFSGCLAGRREPGRSHCSSHIASSLCLLFASLQCSTDSMGRSPSAVHLGKALDGEQRDLLVDCPFL